jgi:hypothetical protein
VSKTRISRRWAHDTGSAGPRLAVVIPQGPGAPAVCPPPAASHGKPGELRVTRLRVGAGAIDDPQRQSGPTYFFAVSLPTDTAAGR